MGFRPPPQQPDFSSLAISLAQIKPKKEDEALYQTIKFLIEKTKQFQGVTLLALDTLESTITDASNGYPSQLGHSSL
jgi:hypothetical protein